MASQASDRARIAFLIRVCGSEAAAVYIIYALILRAFSLHAAPGSTPLTTRPKMLLVARSVQRESRRGV